MIAVSETNRADVKAEWLSQIMNAYGRYCRAGWEFIFLLRDGIDALPRNEQERYSLYEDTFHLTGLSIKTQQNYVSAARKPYAMLAQELGLEIGHLDAVLGLEDQIAEDVLKLAAENFLTIAQTRKEAWARKAAPDIGKQLADAADDYLSGDDEPPYNDNAMYTDEPASLDRMPVPDLADYIRREYDEGEIAALIAALLR